MKADSEQDTNDSNQNWLNRAQLHAEEFRILKSQTDDELAPDHIKQKIDNYLSDPTDWNRQAKKYLFASNQRNKKNANIRIAAEFALCETNAEKSLIAALELARNGLPLCSIAATIRIIESKQASKQDKLNACILVVEKIATHGFTSAKRDNIKVDIEMIIYKAQANLQLIKILQMAMSLMDEKEQFDEFSNRLKEMLKIKTAESARAKIHDDERKALLQIGSRIRIKKELSKTHQKPVVRSIHHLACTGGTVICKCIAAMHNVALISEVNPLFKGGSDFNPTNPLLLLRKSYREFTIEEKIESFKIQINYALEICRKDDVDLVIREHSHTDFHSSGKESGVCAISDRLTEDYDLLSVVTVRHPLDSYLGLIKQGWANFKPNTLDEYSRRYLSFLEKYKALPRIRYEDFCDNPQKEIRKICELLRIDYNDNFLKIFSDYTLSGDSGRTGLKKIKIRQRRDIPEEVKAELGSSAMYSRLTSALGYNEQ